MINVPVPKATLVPATFDSHPLLALAYAENGPNLPSYGFVENEYFVSGTANVYSWASDGSISILTPNTPYTTRILVRMPKDPSKFSGNVIVELMNPAHRMDYDLVWGGAHDYFLSHNDAWVGVTFSPVTLGTLKLFNASRYGSLSMANPVPFRGPSCTTADPTGEPGLEWDIISQVGALLRSGNASSPLAGFNVEHVYGTAQTGGDLPGYINAIAPLAKLSSGKPVFDGYLVKDSGSPGRINQCAVKPAEGDPRSIDRPPHVPIIRVLAQDDSFVFGYFHPYERPDSDDPNDLYRLYEVPGPNEAMLGVYQSLSYSDIMAFKGEIPTRCPVALPNDYPFRYVLDGAFANLDRWVRTGKAPPRAERIQLTMAGKVPTAYATDEFGNIKGGVRTPYVDVPIATYVTGCPTSAQGFNVQFARDRGYKLPFDASRLKSLYPTHQDYVNKVNAEVDRMLQDGWLTQMDAGKIKAEAASAYVPN